MEKLLLALVFVSLAACGSVSDSSPTNLDSYNIVTGSFGTSSESNLSGVGTIRFVNTLSGVSATHHIRLAGSLDLLSGSTLSVILFSDSLIVDNESGVEIRFSRTGASVEGLIRVQNSTGNMDQTKLNLYFPAQLDLLIQVTNSSSGARVLVWRRDFVTYSIANADIDSSALSDVSPALPSTGGLGLYAGLKLNNATVTSAQIGNVLVTAP